jgi:hypothetical protein
MIEADRRSARLKSQNLGFVLTDHYLLTRATGGAIHVMANILSNRAHDYSYPLKHSILLP